MLGIIKPATAIPKAKTCPMDAAILVARLSGMFIASSERKTLPPSIGSAGIILNNGKVKLAIKSPSKNDARCSSIVKSGTEPCFASTKGKRIAAITIFTRGPAKAICNSCEGVGLPSMNATPPSKYSVMSLVLIPKRRATSACPSS